jgi:hypothetical protein
VALARDVVVVAVDCRRLEPEARELAAQGGEHGGEHQLAVHVGVLLRPVDGLDVVVEELRALAQVGEVAVRQAQLVALHLAAREVDECRCVSAPRLLLWSITQTRSSRRGRA